MIVLPARRLADLPANTAIQMPIQAMAAAGAGAKFCLLLISVPVCSVLADKDESEKGAIFSMEVPCALCDVFEDCAEILSSPFMLWGKSASWLWEVSIGVLSKSCCRVSDLSSVLSGSLVEFSVLFGSPVVTSRLSSELSFRY